MALSLFNLLASGSGSVGLDVWINLGTIPTGLVNWIGSASYTSISKAITFELRTNLAGQSAGTLVATKLLASGAPRAGATLTQDLYKGGRISTRTVVGTGVEKWWLHLYSKSNTAGTYMYKISYTQV